jgi:Arc/MetJ family transcription regulator
MAKVRAPVAIDEDLLKEAKRIAKTTAASGAVTYAMQELVRRASLAKLASLLGTDGTFKATPRRRPK